MIKKLQLTLGILCFFLGYSNAQITNDNINYEVKSLRYTTEADGDDDSLDDIVIRVRTEIDDGTGTGMVTDLVCHNWECDAPCVSENSDILIVSASSTLSSSTLNFYMLGYESDNSDVCNWYSDDQLDWQGGSTVDDGGVITAQSTPGVWGSSWGTDNSEMIFPNAVNYNMGIRSIWRYSHGDSADDPLQFPTLGMNSSFSHFNSNFAAPTDIEGDVILGYTNSLEQSGPDVFYSFTLTESANVVMSTDDVETDSLFDTFMVLMNENGSVLFINDDIDGANNRRSEIDVVLCPGTYTILVEGYNNNQGNFKLNLSSSLPVLSANPTISPTTCDNNSGSITVDIQGGMEPYDFMWSSNATSGTGTIANLAEGNYTLTITDACQNISIFEGIEVPNTVTQELAIIDQNISPTSCDNDSGSISLTVQGGLAPYTYVWSNNATSETISGLAEGDYSVTVTDACLSTSVINTIAIVNVVTAELDIAGQNIQGTTCENNSGSIALTVEGGLTPYTYMWSNNATTESISDLGEGEYSVTVTDACSSTSVLSGMTIVNTVTSDVAITGQDIQPTSCASNSGSISVLVDGGLAPYTYSWSNNSTSESIAGLSEGLYSVTVTDACQQIAVVSGMSIVNTDTDGPNMVCMDVSFDLNAGESITLTAADLDNGSTDDCGITEFTLSQTVFDQSNVGATSVVLTGVDALGQSSNCNAIVTINVLTAINELEGLEKWNVYPNPVSEQLTFELELEEIGEESILTITDIHGRILVQQLAKNGIQRFDVSNWTSAVYLLQVRKGDAVKSERILVQR